MLHVRFRVHPAALLDDPRSQAALDANWSTIRVVDLFELPQRIAHRQRVVALRAEGKPFREIG